MKTRYRLPAPTAIARKTIMRVTGVSLLLFAFAGCYSSQVAPDTVERANQHLARVEKGDAPAASEEEKARLAQLFADRPDYFALVTRDDAQATVPRLRAAVPPAYPLGAYVSNTKALVKVAFIVSESGIVEEARIYEASDARFSAAAIEAVKAWTFYPGRHGGTPSKFLMVVPVQFDGRAK